MNTRLLDALLIPRSGLRAGDTEHPIDVIADSRHPRFPS